MQFLKMLFATSNDRVLGILRLTLGVISLAHGAQEAIGVFGGLGLFGTIGFFSHALHIPAPLAFISIMAEFLGGIALIFGIASRFAALAIAINMLVALTFHASNGLFMNW